jgi:hypothetical protein
MSAAVELLVVVASVAAALAILLYATWLLTHRLRRGESKRMAFKEWLRNAFEAIWGL